MESHGPTISGSAVGFGLRASARAMIELDKKSMCDCDGVDRVSAVANTHACRLEVISLIKRVLRTSSAGAQMVVPKTLHRASSLSRDSSGVRESQRCAFAMSWV